MVGVCNQCGLPQDLCVCEVIAREQQKITVKTEKRKFGKVYTIVGGIRKEANVEEITRRLKTKFASNTWWKPPAMRHGSLPAGSAQTSIRTECCCSR